MTDVRISRRRAFAARLLVCVVPIALFLVVANAAAAEQPVTPIITGTNPASSEEAPAGSITPKVFGESEPVIIKDSAPLFEQPVLTALQQTKNPNFIIEVFSGEECSGAAIGSTSAGAFDVEG